MARWLCLFTDTVSEYGTRPAAWSIRQPGQRVHRADEDAPMSPGPGKPSTCECSRCLWSMLMVVPGVVLAIGVPSATCHAGLDRDPMSSRACFANRLPAMSEPAVPEMSVGSKPAGPRGAAAHDARRHAGPFVRKWDESDASGPFLRTAAWDRYAWVVQSHEGLSTRPAQSRRAGRSPPSTPYPSPRAKPPGSGGAGMARGFTAPIVSHDVAVPGEGSPAGADRDVGSSPLQLARPGWRISLHRHLT